MNILKYDKLFFQCPKAGVFLYMNKNMNQARKEKFPMIFLKWKIRFTAPARYISFFFVDVAGVFTESR